MNAVGKSIEELRKMPVEECKQEVADTLAELMNLRMRRGMEGSEQTHKVKPLRRYVARVKTILTERQVNGG